MSVVEVVQLLVSPVHRYMGRPSEGPSAAAEEELVRSVEVRRNLGIVGDRYYAHTAHRDAAVTLMSAENLPLDINPAADLRLTRRNVLLRGIDIDAYVGSTVSLDTGAGPVLLAVRRPARPCAWMDAVIGPGAQRCPILVANSKFFVMTPSWDASGRSGERSGTCSLGLGWQRGHGAVDHERW